MSDVFPLYILMILIIALLIVLAGRIKVAYPILLVLAGLGISFFNGIPKIHIEPRTIFVIFLPPLLYVAAWTISSKELWRWRRIIGSFAFGVVFFTALSVALVANSLIPGFTLALGFLLGGIVSPPDGVSVTEIVKFVKIPKRMSSVLEGESLLNDTASLIIFRFALIAVATGQFIWWKAVLNFGWVVITGIIAGLVVGWIFIQMHKRLSSDTNVDVVLTIIAPYLMYLSGEFIHGSGVIAVIAGGLLLSNKRYMFLKSGTRLRGADVWESLLFVLNGAIFMLLGLDLPQIISALRSESITLSTAIGYSLVIAVVLILSRIIFSFLSVFITLAASRFIKVADDRNPGYKTPLIFGWTGMRGVASLAAALSIPLQMNGGASFPHRSLILFITFVVILFTLLLQGLTLPYLIKRLKPSDYADHLSENEAEVLISRGFEKSAHEYLSGNFGEGNGVSSELHKLVENWIEENPEDKHERIQPVVKKKYLELLNKQRNWLLDENRSNINLDEEIVRKFLLRIDMEEARVNLE
ncbi:MAG TPA: Na+/H+ antiporter [Puia sp.]|nr:Na+/H+ antiporter [Puia sp.]